MIVLGQLIAQVNLQELEDYRLRYRSVDPFAKGEKFRYWR